jgi:hypothetical protein
VVEAGGPLRGAIVGVRGIVGSDVVGF